MKNRTMIKGSCFQQELLFYCVSGGEKLYSALKRRTDKAPITGDEQGDVSGFEIGENKVMFEGGKIWTKVKGIKEEFCTIKEFADKPNMRFRGLMEYLKRLRGM